jgi:hypothetical protein
MSYLISIWPLIAVIVALGWLIKMLVIEDY